MNVKEKLKVMEEVEAANRKHMEVWKQDQSRTIKGVLIDTLNGTAEVKEIRKDLDSYYEVLNCCTIDVIRRTIGGKPFEIICDDEAALVDCPLPSAFDPSGTVMLFGNLFVVRFDGREDVESLSDAEIAHVMRNCFKLCLTNGKERKVYTALRGVAYF